MQLILDIPEKFFSSKQDDRVFADKIKLYGALLLFQSGKLSRGAACEFAGVDIYTFLAACKKHKISVINTEVDDIETDLYRFTQKHLT